jgi:hypothetical protein
MESRHYLWLIARLGVAVVLVGWAYSYLMPDSGDKEFQRMSDMLKNVSTIHYEMTSDPVTGLHIEDSGDLVCADDVLRRRNDTTQNSIRPLRTQEEIIRVGMKEYILQESGLWNTGDSHLVPYISAREACQQLRNGMNTWFAPDFDRIVAHSVISKGEKKKLPDGETCREWKVTFLIGQPGTPGASQHHRVCIGEKSHLLREIANQEGRTLIKYAFNRPLKIEAPTEAEMVPETERKQQLGTITPGSLFQ